MFKYGLGAGILILAALLMIKLLAPSLPGRTNLVPYDRATHPPAPPVPSSVLGIDKMPVSPKASLVPIRKDLPPAPPAPGPEDLQKISSGPSQWIPPRADLPPAPSVPPVHR